MSQPENERYHRIGEPGGSGCKVAALEIQMKDASGEMLHADLLDAGAAATELELLRTVVNGLGVRWGRDDLGWWAAVPRRSRPS
jgi:hypothetical protein